MLTLLTALALAQAVVIDRAEHAPDAAMTAELLQRPAGLTTTAFLDQLIAEAGAAEWERRETAGPYEGAQVRIVGLRRTQGDGLMFFLPAAEDSRGSACRIRRLREGAPEAQGEQLLRYCLSAVAAGR